MFTQLSALNLALCINMQLISILNILSVKITGTVKSLMQNTKLLYLKLLFWLLYSFNFFSFILFIFIFKYLFLVPFYGNVVLILK